MKRLAVVAVVHVVVVINWRPLDGGEANVVLLDDRGIQRVKVEQEDALVIESLLWIEDEAA